MSVNFSCGIFYGIEIEEKGDDFYDFMDETQGPDFSVGINNLTPMNEAKFVMYVKDSYISVRNSDDTMFVQIPINTPTLAEWDKWLQSMCDDYGYTYTQPTWVFFTSYT